MNLEILTREQLIEALKLYQSDVDELTAQIDVLNDANLKLFKKANDKIDEASAYKSMYDKIKGENTDLIKQNLRLLDEVEHLEFSVKKHKATAISASVQAADAKRKYKHPEIKFTNINCTCNLNPKLEDIMYSDEILIDNIGCYSPNIKIKH